MDEVWLLTGVLSHLQQMTVAGTIILRHLPKPFRLLPRMADDLHLPALHGPTLLDDVPAPHQDRQLGLFRRQPDQGHPTVRTRSDLSFSATEDAGPESDSGFKRTSRRSRSPPCWS